MANEKAKIILNPANLPNADELRGTRIRIAAPSGSTFDLVFFIDENPPTHTVPIGLTAQAPGLSYSSLYDAILDAMQSDEAFSAEFTGLPGLVVDTIQGGSVEDIRVIGGNGKITVQTTQQGS